jgi:Fe-S-cluster-containing dehydrogenase component
LHKDGDASRFCMVTITLDNKQITVPEETSILEAARLAGVYIPRLCFHPDLPAVDGLKPARSVHRNDVLLENRKEDLRFEGCRLCVVEIEGREGLPRACNTAVTEGMVIRTDTPATRDARLDRMMFLLARHPHACMTCAQQLGCARFPCSTNVPERERCCAQFGKCEFQKTAEYVGIKPETPRYYFADLPAIKNDPLFERDYNLCIGCSRCIRACRDLRGVGALDFVFDEEGRVLVGTVDSSLGNSACRFCTTCVEVCPTGALTDKRPYEESPCSHACPAGVDVPRYVKLIAEGQFDQSYAVVREKLPLPSVCSYVCVRPCESECRRGDLNEPVAIRDLKRFVSEQHSDLWKRALDPPLATGKRVAIVGSGPTGLTAGYYLARKGHGVTIFEQAPSPGGMLRHAISRKRLPRQALEEDIREILAAGVIIELNSPQADADHLLHEGFDAVLLATGNNFVGPAVSFSKDHEQEFTFKGVIKTDPASMRTAKEGVFAGGDAVLGGVSADFIRSVLGSNGGNFAGMLVELLATHLGDSSRSAVRAIACGRKAAQAIDSYLGGDGAIDERLIEPEKTDPYLGRKEGFTDLPRLSSPYRPPVPQYAGMSPAEPVLSREEAVAEAARCLRCDLRLQMAAPILPPRQKSWLEFNQANVARVPEVEGVFQLLDGSERVIFIKGAMNMRGELRDQLELCEEARFFTFAADQMFSKKESEMLQHYIVEHGQMPKLNQELEDLF